MKKYLWIVSLCLYASAFYLPVYATSTGPAEVGQGVGMFVFGWMEAVCEQVMGLSWFANLFFIAALCTTWKFPITSTFLGAFSILTALYFLKGGEIFLLYSSLNQESGYLTEIKIGYWAWVGSMVVMLAGAIFRVIEKRKLNMN